MIDILKLNKKYGESYALKNVDLSLPRYGIVAIKGPSGCGKTTFLNCIAGLIPFDGTIKIDGQNIDPNNDNLMSDIRLSTMGFIFQDFRLFENEIVIENLLFPLETLTNLDEEKKQIKCHELLKLVGLEGKEKQFVSSLSGGEKQRLCIARSIINDPKLILADEPTGALDSKNSLQIMDILEKLSSNSLIIMVTHDNKLAQEYGDVIVDMKDGKIMNVGFNTHHNHFMYLPILKNGVTNKKPSISLRFLFKHSLHSMMHKKVRSFICTLTTSLGLIGVGLASSLSAFISSNIKDAYSSLIKEDQIMISTKNHDKTVLGEYAGSFYEAESLARKNPDYINDVGVCYFADFETFFPDSNELVFSDSAYRTPFKGFTARNINEFEWLDTCENEFYPHKFSSLKDDEICMGLNMSAINELCYILRIERSVKSLSNYLLINNCYFVYNFENSSWEYSDQQTLNLRGFCLETNLKIYHSNHLWNEYMLEERMRFPTSDSISENDYYPWVMKKIPYLYCNQNIDEFLSYANNNADYEDYILEIATTKYFPLLYKDVDIKDKRRVLFLMNTVDCIPLSHINYFCDCDNNLVSPILGSKNGYVIYPGSLMMGFSDNAFLSCDYSAINDAIDIETSVKLSNDQIIDYPDNIYLGHFTKSMQNGLIFENLPNELLIGEKPNGLDEIVISSGIYAKFGEDILNKEIYFSFPINESLNVRGELIKEYKIIPLKVTGIVKNIKPIIYHNFMWPISFFQSRLGISMYKLKTQTISFSLKDSRKIEDTLKHIKKGFPQYNVINPLNDINDSVNDLCKNISFISIFFSLVSCVTSILLLTICAYIQVIESRKEIGLARCIGVNKKESNKLIYCHSVFLCLISFIVSAVELIMISGIISFELTGNLSIILEPISFILMLVLSAIISIFSGKIISMTLNKNSAIEIAKY